MKKKFWLIPLAIIIVLAGGLAAFWPFGGRQVLRFPGIVEIQEVRLGSKIGGRVLDVQIKEGDIVYGDRPLLVFETPELESQRLQLMAKLASAKAEFERAKNGARPEEKDAARAAMNSAQARADRVEHGWRVEEKKQAESELESAQADFDQAMKDWVRVSTLYREKSAARNEYDAALAYRDRAKGRKDSALAKVVMMKVGSREEDKAEAKSEWVRTKAMFELLDHGTRKEDIDMAAAKVAELEANVKAIDINLDEAIVRVPPKLGKAVVEVVAVRPGDLVPANQPVIRVLRVEDLWVKIFVPETKYGLVTLNKEVEVTIDTHPGKKLKGVVVQRSNISEFTPRNVQSVDERRHQVFGVKIRVDDPDGVLNAGMAAEVTIKVD